MSNDNSDLVNGLFAKEPHPNAPDFVKGKLSIKLADFAGYLRELKASEPDVEWINLDVKVSQAGKWYVMRDNWKPDPSRAAPEPNHPTGAVAPDEDLPF